MVWWLLGLSGRNICCLTWWDKTSEPPLIAVPFVGTAQRASFSWWKSQSLMTIVDKKGTSGTNAKIATKIHGNAKIKKLHSALPAIRGWTLFFSVSSAVLPSFLTSPIYPDTTASLSAKKKFQRVSKKQKIPKQNQPLFFVDWTLTLTTDQKRCI